LIARVRRTERDRLTNASQLSKVVLSIPTVAPRTTGLRTDQSVCLHACQIDTIVHHSMLAICSGLWGISPLCARGLWSSLPWTSKSPRVLLERQRRPHTPSLLALGSACSLLELPTACNGRPTASFLPGPCRRAHAPCTLAALYWPHFSLARCSASMGRMSVCL